MYYFSPSRNGIFIEAQKVLNPDSWPEDAKPISKKLRDTLMMKMSKGFLLSSDKDGNPVTVEAEAPEITKDNLIAQVAAKRFEVETGGITLPDGSKIGTDRDDQAMINGAIVSTGLGVESVDWKGESGWIEVSAADLQMIGAAVAHHVQACFSAERVHVEAIQKLKASELAKYDINIGWPI